MNAVVTNLHASFMAIFFVHTPRARKLRLTGIVQSSCLLLAAAEGRPVAAVNWAKQEAQQLILSPSL